MKSLVSPQRNLKLVVHQLEQREAELALINSIQEGIVSRMDMQGIYELAGDRIRNLFDAQVVLVATFNFENHTEEVHYLFEDGKRIFIEPRPIGKLRQRLIDARELIYLNENAVEMWISLTGETPKALPGTQLAKSALYVPMVVGLTVRGYISLQNVDRENAFSESDVRLLSTLANSMSIALENARLFNETEQRNAELAVINSVQQGLVAEMDMQGIYDLVGDRIRDLFDAQVTGIDTYDHNTGMEHFQYLFEDGERYFPEPRPFTPIAKSMIKSGLRFFTHQNKSRRYQKGRAYRSKHTTS